MASIITNSIVSKILQKGFSNSEISIEKATKQMQPLVFKIKLLTELTKYIFYGTIERRDFFLNNINSQTNITNKTGSGITLKCATNQTKGKGCNL